MPSIILVTHMEPSDIGHGGNHRTYQILHDLQSSVGKEHIFLVSLPIWRRSFSADSSVTLFERFKQRVLRVKANPLKLMVHATYSPHLFSFPKFLSYYRRLVSEIPKPILCVLEHSGFAGVVEINKLHCIPTIACEQNIEAFDRGTPNLSKNKLEIYTRSIDFACEFEVLAKCAERLFISKVETGLIGGLGLPARYYPYLPVGNIRKRLEMNRQRRQVVTAQPRLLLMLGSAGHYSTRKSFQWFIENAKLHGLPKHIKVLVGGAKTEELIDKGEYVPGIELMGWLPQEKLNELLSLASAVLIPQQLGFGALTRLVELSCAGIPVITSNHATHAIDPPPGVYSVDDTWSSWTAAIEKIVSSNECVNPSEFGQWEEEQPKTLRAVLLELVKNI